MNWFKYIGIPLLASIVLYYTGSLKSTSDFVLFIFAACAVSLFFWYKDRYNFSGVGSSLPSKIDLFVYNLIVDFIQANWKQILIFLFIFFVIAFSTGVNFVSFTYSLIVFSVFSLLYSEHKRQEEFKSEFAFSNYSSSCSSCGYSYHRRSSSSYVCPRCGSRNVLNK